MSHFTFKHIGKIIEAGICRLNDLPNHAKTDPTGPLPEAGRATAVYRDTLDSQESLLTGIDRPDAGTPMVPVPTTEVY